MRGEWEFSKKLCRHWLRFWGEIFRRDQLMNWGWVSWLRLFVCPGMTWRPNFGVRTLANWFVSCEKSLSFLPPTLPLWRLRINVQQRALTDWYFNRNRRKGGQYRDCAPLFVTVTQLNNGNNCILNGESKIDQNHQIQYKKTICVGFSVPAESFTAPPAPPFAFRDVWRTWALGDREGWWLLGRKIALHGSK